LIHFPSNPSFIYLDTTAQLNCKLDVYGWKTDQKILNELKKHGAINFDKSTFDRITKPLHFLEIYTDSKDTVGLESIWYKEKVNVSRIFLKDSTRCN
jgi:hypothetical protein